jgi:uncharacterized protein (AIM24 family)
MSFLEPSSIVHQHAARSAHACDLGFSISGRIMQQVALTLAPGQSVVTWLQAIIAHDDGISFDSAGHPALVMASCNGGGDTKLVLSPGGPVGAFELASLSGRVLLPQDCFLAAGPGVKLRPYSHIRGLVSSRRPSGLVLMLAEGNGWVFSSGQGEVSELLLGAGETLAVRGSAIAALSATVVIDDVVMMQGYPSDIGARAMLRGPGRVWLQSGAAGDATAAMQVPSQLATEWAAPAAQIEYRQGA